MHPDEIIPSASPGLSHNAGSAYCQPFFFASHSPLVRSCYGRDPVFQVDQNRIGVFTFSGSKRD